MKKQFLLILISLQTISQLYAQSPDYSNYNPYGTTNESFYFVPYRSLSPQVLITTPCDDHENKPGATGYRLKPGTRIKPKNSKIILEGPFYYKNMFEVAQLYESYFPIRKGDLKNLNISKIGTTLIFKPAANVFEKPEELIVFSQDAGSGGFKTSYISGRYKNKLFNNENYYIINNLEYTANSDTIKLSAGQLFGGFNKVLCLNKNGENDPSLIATWEYYEKIDPYTPNPENNQAVVNIEIKANSEKIVAKKLSFIDYPNDRVNNKPLNLNEAKNATVSTTRSGKNLGEASVQASNNCSTSFCKEFPNLPCCQNSGPNIAPLDSNPGSSPFVGSGFSLPLEQGDTDFFRTPEANRSNFDNGTFSFNFNSSSEMYLGEPIWDFGFQFVGSLINLFDTSTPSHRDIPQRLINTINTFGACSTEARDMANAINANSEDVWFIDMIITYVIKSCNSEKNRIANEQLKREKERKDKAEQTRIDKRKSDLANGNVYKYRFGPGGDALAVNTNEKQLVDAIKQYLNPSQRRIPNLETALSKYATKRAADMLQSFEDDYRWELVNEIDKQREAIFAINEQLKGSNTNSRLLNQKKNHFNKLRDNFQKLNGLQDYPRNQFLDDLFLGQMRHFFGGGITNENELLTAFEKVKIGNNPNTLKNIENGWDTGSQRGVRNAIDNAGSLGNLPSNPNIDYEILKLETDNKFNALSEPNRSFKNWFDGQKEDIISYLEQNNNSRESVRRVRHLSDRWVDGEPLIIPSPRLQGSNIIRPQQMTNPNLALSSDLSQEALDNGFSGFNNLMHSFFENLPSSPKKSIFEGHIIRQYFDANGFDLPVLINNKIATNYSDVFQFDITENTKFKISYRNDWGNLALLNDLFLPDVINLLENPNTSNVKDIFDNFEGCDNNDNCQEEKDWYLDNDNDGYHAKTERTNQKPGDKWKLFTKGVDCDDTDKTKTTECDDKKCNKFANRVKEVLSTEGGFVNDPADPGGATNKGISWPVWKSKAKSVLGVEPTLNNLKNLTDANANKIYKNLYWDKVRADDINDGDLRFLLFDFYVNAGNNASKTLQRTVNELGGSLVVDGKVGNGTISAINGIKDQVKLYNTYKSNRQKYYDNITTKSVNRYKKKHPKATEADLKKHTFKRFLKGWTNRVNKFKSKSKTNPKDVNCDEK